MQNNPPISEAEKQDNVIPTSPKPAKNWRKLVENIATATTLGIATIQGDATLHQTQNQQTQAVASPSVTPLTPPSITSAKSETVIKKTEALPGTLDRNNLLQIIQTTTPNKHGTPAPRDVYREVMYYLVQQRDIPNAKETLFLIAEKDPYKIVEFGSEIRFGKNAEIAEHYIDVTKKALKALQKKDPENYKWALAHHDYSNIHLEK